jgi:hypothetical protein
VRGVTSGARVTSLLLLAAWLGGCAPRAPQFDPDSVPEAYRRPTGALMWPGATRAFLVTPAGDLYNGEWRVRFDLSAGGTHADPPRVIAAEDRWLPVLHWTRHAGDVRFEFEALAMAAPRDSNLIVSLAVRAVNRGASPAPARLAARLERPDSTPVFVAFDAPATPEAPLRWAARGTTGPAHGWADAGAGAGAEREARWTLRPGEQREVRFLLPVYAVEGEALRAWAGTPHRKRAVEARRFWTRQLGEGLWLQLGDPEVERAVAAARVVLLSCCERRGERWLPIGGPFQYRDVWLRDGARAIQALALSGHTQVARELARGMLGFQWPQGAFLSQRGQLDGTGQALWLMDQALMRPAPDDSVKRFADAALAAVKWLEWQRGIGRESGAPFGAMMPFGDPNDDELVRAQLVGNDAWALAGYAATARLLRASRDSAAAAEVEDSLASYRADFARALERIGRADLPPSWQLVGRDWGNLAAGYPCRVLPADSPRLAALARRVWAGAGGAGMVWYGTPDSLHYYLGADLGTWALLAGRTAQADSVLDALLHWRTASGGAGELFTRGGEFGVNLPPHATSAAAMVTLVRNSLVYDEGDTLRLTLGAREAWWRGARVDRAPTRWGTLDLEFRSENASAEWKWSPVPVWTALTLPPGARLAGAPDPPLRPGRSEREVLAPPGTSGARVGLASGAR